MLTLKPMRRVRYRVAASLDGYIFAAIFSGFDTALLGRRTYELTLQPGAPPWPSDWRVYVFSRTLTQADHPAVTVVSADIGRTVTELRDQPGRDIWLFGGGNLFGSLLAAGLRNVRVSRRS